MIIHGSFSDLVNSANHEGQQPKRVDILYQAFLFASFNQVQQRFKHFTQPYLRFLIDKGRMKALFNKDAFVEMAHPAVYNVQPNGMKTDLERLLRVVITEKGAGRTSDTYIEQGV